MNTRFNEQGVQSYKVGDFNSFGSTLDQIVPESEQVPDAINQGAPIEEQDDLPTSMQVEDQVPNAINQGASIEEQDDLPTSMQVEDPASTQLPPEGGEASMTIEPTS
jgi:hypothetical protein